jgi:hypothetical protein
MGKNNKPNVFDNDKPEKADGSSVVVTDIPVEGEIKETLQLQPEAVVKQPGAKQDTPEEQSEDTEVTSLQDQKSELQEKLSGFEKRIKDGKLSFADAMQKAVLIQSELDRVEREISKDTLRGSITGKIASILDTAKYKPELILIKREKLEDTIHYSIYFNQDEVSEALKGKKSSSGNSGTKSRAIWYNTTTKTEHTPKEVFDTIRSDSKVTETMRRKADIYKQWEMLLNDCHKLGLLAEYEHRR